MFPRDYITILYYSDMWSNLVLLSPILLVNTRRRSSSTFFDPVDSLLNIDNNKKDKEKGKVWTLSKRLILSCVFFSLRIHKVLFDSVNGILHQWPYLLWFLMACTFHFLVTMFLINRLIYSPHIFQSMNGREPCKIRGNREDSFYFFW